MKNRLKIAGIAILVSMAAPGCPGDMTSATAANDCYDQLLPIVGYWIPYAGGAGGAGGSSASSGSSGNAFPVECAKDVDCPKPEEPRCADALCLGGRCAVAFKPVAKIESQIQGDCVSQYCDGQGKIIALPDGEDVYNDGRQCTFDKCEGGAAKNIPMPDGGKCPETGIGVCFASECVNCVESLILCPNGLACDGTRCVPMHCVNNFIDLNLGETGGDCGGPCRPCLTFESCKVGADCVQGSCLGGLCQPPTCSDGVKNDGESGIDCGGPPSCPRCPANQGCDLPSDCESGVCWAGLCQAPKCDDGIANGDEQAVDCGGSCAACGG